MNECHLVLSNKAQIMYVCTDEIHSKSNAFKLFHWSTYSYRMSQHYINNFILVQ